MRFGGELGKAEETVKNVMEGSTPLLTKGAPRGKEDEAARVAGWRMKGKEIEISIESGRYVRAHSALLRIAKELKTRLGEKHKIGLRGIETLEYRIELPITPTERIESELRKLPCEVQRGEKLIVTLRDISEADLRKGMVDRLVSHLESMARSLPPKAPGSLVVKQGGRAKVKFREDPLEFMKREGWVREFPGRGQWTYAPPYARILRAIEDLIIEHIAVPLGFEEGMFPKLIPLEVMRRMPGYLDGIPEGMYYVCPPPRNPESFKDFKQELRLRNEVSRDILKGVVEPPSYVLAPAQCEPFYHMFERSTVEVEDLPIKLFDRSGWTYRWEGGGAEGLIRTHEFRRIEFVFIGKPEDVMLIRDSIKDESIKLLEELEMEWRLTVATPFYLREDEEPEKGPEVATYDLEVKLPYKNGWLEIASLNVHGEKFVKSFKIREVKNRQIWTGCCGFGTTRWVAGFLAQHGFDFRSWPPPVRGRVKSLSTASKPSG